MPTLPSAVLNGSTHSTAGGARFSSSPITVLRPRPVGVRVVIDDRVVLARRRHVARAADAVVPRLDHLRAAERLARQQLVALWVEQPQAIGVVVRRADAARVRVASPARGPPITSATPRRRARPPSRRCAPRPGAVRAVVETLGAEDERRRLLAG